MTGSWASTREGRRWRRSPQPRVARAARARARRRPVRRPRARADDRVAHALRPAPGGARARHPRRRVRRGALPAAPARGRPDAADRRRAARPAHDRRDRQPLEGGGLLRSPASTRGGRPADVSDDEALAIVRAARPRMQQSAPRRRPGARHGDLRPRRAAVPALRRDDPAPRAGRRQPHRPTGAPDASADRPTAASATRAPTSSRPATRWRASTPRSPPASTWSSSTCCPHAPTAPALVARPRLRGRRGAASALTLEEGLDHLATDAYAGIELDVDLKLPGYERAVDRGAARARPARAHADLAPWRSESLPVVRALEPASGSAGRCRKVAPQLHCRTRRRRSRSIARARYRPAACPAAPRRAMRAGRDRRAHGPLALVDPALVRAVARGRRRALRLDGRRAPRIARAEALGVTGVITNDPRLFVSA